MRPVPRRPLCLALAALAWLAVGLVLAPSADDLHAAPRNAPRIVGPQDPQRGCIRCHADEVKAWQKTHHHKSLDLLGESDKAEAIVDALGIDSDPSEAGLCQKCHVTTKSQGRGGAAPEWGVSCESCHGAAEHWLDVHNDYGPGIKDRAQESAAHRAARLQKADAAGMIRPANLYRLAWNCLSCHVVPEEALVSTGHHPAGSKDFDLLVWSQGEVRHNYLHDRQNPEATPERKRVLHVVGRLVDLEVSVRALARATRAGPYATAMAQRIRSTKQVLGRLQQALGTSSAGKGLGAALGAIPDAHIKHGNAAALGTIAGRLRQVGTRFAEKFADGSALAAVDPLLPRERKGAVHGR